MNERELVKQLIKVAGFHNDTKAGTRLLIENRISKKAYDTAFNAGRTAKENGVPCSCRECAKQQAAA